MVSITWILLCLELCRQELGLGRPQCSIHNLCCEDSSHSLNGSWLFEAISFEVAFSNYCLNYLESIVDFLTSQVMRHVEQGLRHLAPIIQTHRQDQEQMGHEKPVGAIYSSNILTKIEVALAWFSYMAHGQSEGGRSHRLQLNSMYHDNELRRCPYYFNGKMVRSNFWIESAMTHFIS